MSEGPTESPGHPDQAFAWAVKTGDLSGVKEFIESKKFGANFVESGLSKGTPMHWAADYNQVEVLDYLISKGGNVNAKNAHGITPLLAAVYENHEPSVKFLLSKGADVNVKGPDGMIARDAAEKPEIKALFK